MWICARLAVIVVAAWLASAQTASQPAPLIDRVSLSAPFEGGRSVLIPETPATRTGALLVVGDLSNTPRLFVFKSTQAGQAEFTRLEESAPGDLPARGWLIPADLVGRLLPRWPVAAALHAAVDTVGVDARSVWINVGSDAGVRAGDSFWARPGGQPLARFDVRYVEPDLCFAAVAPLVRDLDIQEDLRVSLWPTPGQRRRDSARSAVSHIESTAGATFIWVPRPPRGRYPADTRLDLYREGRYVAHAVVERQDERFWYARVLDLPAIDAATLASAPANAPATTQRSDLVHVGDDCIVRTAADIAQRRFVARVFEKSADGWLITAGELDGLRTGEDGEVYRNGVLLGKVRIARVQNVYSVAEAAARQPLELQLGDAVRFTPLPSGKWIGQIDDTWPDNLFHCRLTSKESPPLFEPLAVRKDGRTLAVAVLLDSAGEAGMGFVIPASASAPPAAGMDLVAETED